MAKLKLKVDFGETTWGPNFRGIGEGRRYSCISLPAQANVRPGGFHQQAVGSSEWSLEFTARLSMIGLYEFEDARMNDVLPHASLQTEAKKRAEPKNKNVAAALFRQ